LTLNWGKPTDELTISRDDDNNNRRRKRARRSLSDEG
jgi:hypothetical protein